MQVLLKYPYPIVRYSLYAHVNQYLKKRERSNIEGHKNLTKSELNFYGFLQEKKELSTSSFYNSLSNLEKKGFVAFRLNQKGKVESVEATPLTTSIINKIFQLFLERMPNYSEYIRENLEGIIKKLGSLFQKSKLLINLLSELTTDLLKGFIENCEEAFIISSDETYEDFYKLGIKDFKITEVYKGKIREPNDVFDRVIIRPYKKISDFHGLTRIELLKEAFRVTKPGGRLIVYAIDSLPETENYYANELLSMVNQSMEQYIFEKHEFRQELEEAGILNLEILDIKGFLIGIGKK